MDTYRFTFENPRTGTVSFYDYELPQVIEEIPESRIFALRRWCNWLLSNGRKFVSLELLDPSQLA